MVLSARLMKHVAMLLVLFVACCGSVFAASEGSPSDPVIATFGSALGYPDARTVEDIRKDLVAALIGKSRPEVKSYGNRVVHNRGTLGATLESGAGSLSLSYWSALLNRDTASLSVRFFYDDSGEVSRIECTYKT
jgi:hypothetical protein